VGRTGDLPQKNVWIGGRDIDGGVRGEKGTEEHASHRGKRGNLIVGRCEAKGK